MAVANPLGRRVDARAVELVVGVGLEGAGAEVDEADVERSQLHQNVLALDVAMDDAELVAGDDGLEHLVEEDTRQLLVEDALLGDEVEEVLDGLGSLEDDDEGVGTLEPFHQLDDTGYRLDASQQRDLQRHPNPIALVPSRYARFRDVLDRDGKRVGDPTSGVYSSKAALAQDVANTILLLEDVGRGIDIGWRVAFGHSLMVVIAAVSEERHGFSKRKVARSQQVESFTNEAPLKCSSITNIKLITTTTITNVSVCVYIATNASV